MPKVNAVHCRLRVFFYSNILPPGIKAGCKNVPVWVFSSIKDTRERNDGFRSTNLCSNEINLRKAQFSDHTDQWTRGSLRPLHRYGWLCVRFCFNLDDIVKQDIVHTPTKYAACTARIASALRVCILTIIANSGRCNDGQTMVTWDTS